MVGDVDVVGRWWVMWRMTIGCGRWWSSPALDVGRGLTNGGYVTERVGGGARGVGRRRRTLRRPLRRPQRLHPLCDDVQRGAVFLEPAADGEERLHAHGVAVASIDVGLHDDVDRAVLVFHEHEDVSLGGTRTLPGGDET